MDISLNARIYNDLKQKIKASIYKEDDLLPTELQLMAEYGVSRAPVRQALGRLESEGIIIRKAGKGTFVARKELWQSATLGGFRAEFLKKANSVVCNVISVEEIVPTATYQALLETAADEKIVRVVRLRSLNGEPFQYLEHYIKGIGVEKIIAAGNIEDMPAFLAQNGYDLHDVREEIESVLLPKGIAAKLKVEQNTPVLKIKRSAYDAANKLYEYVIYYTKTTNWKYRVQYTK